MELPLEGGCFCRALRYRVRSISDAGYCHCRICLRTTGAPAHTWFCVRDSDFELLAGSPRSFRSSDFFTRYFCETCGVGVYGTDDRPASPKVGSRLVSLAIGTLDDPEAVQPQIHQWWASRVSWHEAHDQLPKIEDGQLPHPASRSVRAEGSRLTIRVAGIADVEAMARLSERFRMRLSTYAPIFWRMAEGSFEKQAGWFRMLLALEDTCAFVAEADSEVKGFAIGRLQEAPPVFAPGGPVCLIDDFCVASDGEWVSVGTPLLEAVEENARGRGAVISVVISPHRGAAKCSFLRQRHFEVAAEWYVREL